ncbi:hypothetical protein [Actinomyces sp.]|nr:hypothetical protein [Actinomyces sp.]MDU6757678.1 hypothetical protein [Actinomyces sp.]
MALKQYEYRGSTWQFEEGKQPAGAVEIETGQAQTKARRPANKARKTADK